MADNDYGVVLRILNLVQELLHPLLHFILGLGRCVPPLLVHLFKVHSDAVGEATHVVSGRHLGQLGDGAAGTVGTDDKPLRVATTHILLFPRVGLELEVNALLMGR